MKILTPTWLIYHPARQRTVIGNLTVYHDKFDRNEDPYIWHDNFLHTYCHITQLTNVEKQNQINFWVSGDSYPNFNQLLCDCVFVIAEKHFWTNRNHIANTDPIVDNIQSFQHHYNWVNRPHSQHQFKKRQRYTLKADDIKSFQPQDSNGNLIDILQFLNYNGITTEQLRSSISHTKSGKRARNSRPFKLPENLGEDLYEYLLSKATIKLLGFQLKNLHP